MKTAEDVMKIAPEMRPAIRQMICDNIDKALAAAYERGKREGQQDHYGPGVIEVMEKQKDAARVEEREAILEIVRRQRAAASQARLFGSVSEALSGVEYAVRARATRDGE